MAFCYSVSRVRPHDEANEGARVFETKGILPGCHLAEMQSDAHELQADVGRGSISTLQQLNDLPDFIDAILA